MWIYEKKLQYPAWVEGCDLEIAKLLFAQYGGPDSELSAGLRYLTQRYTMPIPQAKAILTDIGISLSKLHIFYTQSAQADIFLLSIYLFCKIYKI